MTPDPPAKPVTLTPLTPEEALKAFMEVKLGLGKG